MCPAPSHGEIVSRINRVQTDPEYRKSLSEFEVNQECTTALLAYSDAISNPEKLDPTQKLFLQNFILNALGNTELNKAISTVNAKPLKDTGISADDTWELRNFTYKTRHVQQFENIAGKLREVNQALQLDQPIPAEKRLTLREYGIIADMAKSFQVLDKLNSAGVLEGNERLMNLHQDAKVAKALVTKMESEFKANMQVDPGTIAFDNTKKKSEVKGMTMSFYDSLVDKTVTKYTHASKIYSGASAPTSASSSSSVAAAAAASSATSSPAASSADEVKISHINPGYESRSFPMNEFLYADTYRINLAKLISPQDQKLLMANGKMGENWLGEINKEFKEIERTLHDREVRSFRKLRAADDGQQRQAGLMAFTAHLGYKKAGKNNFQEIHDRMFSEYYRLNNCEMLCSEFVAQTTIATLVELNDRLKKKYGLDHDVIAIPIGAHEDLSVMHPGRFLDVLKSKNCLERVEGPNVVNMYIQRDGIAQPEEAIDLNRKAATVFAESKASPVSLGPRATVLLKGTPEILNAAATERAATPQTKITSVQTTAITKPNDEVSRGGTEILASQQNAPLLFQASKSQSSASLKVEENDQNRKDPELTEKSPNKPRM